MRNGVRDDVEPVQLYLHMPKTGGTTLNRIVYTQYAEEVPSAPPLTDWLVRDGLEYTAGGIYHLLDGFSKRPAPALSSTDLAKHRPRAILGHFSFGIHAVLSQRASYITLLRHPVSRVVSLYNHHRRYMDDSYGVISEGLTLEEFVTTTRCLEADNDQTRRLAGIEPPFGKCSRAMLERAKRNIRRHFLLVGLTERFDETLILLKQAFGWDDVRYLSRLVNPDATTRQSFPQESREAIVARNEVDMELYHFAQSAFDDLVREQDSMFADELKRFKIENELFIRENTWEPLCLSTATQEELARLPGIGPVIAQRIVGYRDQRGGIESVHELAGIPGIGPTRMCDVADLVTP